MTRKEHVDWCKKRALDYLDINEPSNAVASMISDLRKHDETKDHIGVMLGAALTGTPGWIDNKSEVRKWIEGFN